MKSRWMSLTLLVVFFLLGTLFNASFNPSLSASDAVAKPRQHAPVIAPRIPQTLTLFGETVPMEQFGIKESLDQELVVNTYRHSSTILYMKRASRWFPMIVPILEEEGIPEDFKYLAVIESGLLQVVSPAGASGFWQFMKDTAPEFDLEVSSTVDERYHVEKATRAACHYLKRAYDRFGSWVLAAASYNMGMAGVSEALEEQQVASYWDLHLNKETARYIFRLLALREVMERPNQFGFFLQAEDMYTVWKGETIEVTEGIESLTAFAIEHQTTLKSLKAMNPWLRDDRLVGKPGKTYLVKVPA